MRFSTSKNELQEALQKLSKATPLRSTLPVLSCVLINATNEGTTLISTDLELTISVSLSVSIEDEGSAAVPLKQLYDITNEFSDGTRITISVDNKNKILSYTFRCSKSCNSNYAYNLIKASKPKMIENHEIKNEMLRNFYKDSKKVSNKKIKKVFSYKLKFPTYKEGLNNIFNYFI